MAEKILSSLKHPFVLYCIKLKEDRSFRWQEKKTILFGSKILSELPKGSIEILLETYPHASGLSSDVTYIVTDAIIQKIYGAGTVEPLAAIVTMPQRQDITMSRRLLILDSISDPGNLGTLFRTAVALGVDGIFLLGACCDPFNDKALRAAKGATFHIPFDSGDEKKLNSILMANKRDVYIADMKGQSVRSVDTSTPSALILSSESKGAKEDYKKRFIPVAIPMSGRIESLNVAIAGAILIYQLWGEQ